MSVPAGSVEITPVLEVTPGEHSQSTCPKALRSAVLPWFHHYTFTLTLNTQVRRGRHQRTSSGPLSAPHTQCMAAALCLRAQSSPARGSKSPGGQQRVHSRLDGASSVASPLPWDSSSFPRWHSERDLVPPPLLVPSRHSRPPSPVISPLRNDYPVF
jgi:hypothetical protein